MHAMLVTIYDNLTELKRKKMLDLKGRFMVLIVSWRWRRTMKRYGDVPGEITKKLTLRL